MASFSFEFTRFNDDQLAMLHAAADSVGGPVAGAIISAVTSEREQRAKGKHLSSITIPTDQKDSVLGTELAQYGLHRDSNNDPISDFLNEVLIVLDDEAHARGFHQGKPPKR